MFTCWQCNKEVKSSEEINQVDDYYFCMECFEAIITGQIQLREELD
jgi:predicted DNA-binding protein